MTSQDIKKYTILAITYFNTQEHAVINLKP